MASPIEVLAANGSNPDYNYVFQAVGSNPAGTAANLVSVPGSLTTTGAAAINQGTSELLQTLGNTVADQGTAAADTAQQQGFTNEANAYGGAEAAYGGVEAAYGTVAQSYQSAAQVANNNATLEASAGNIEQYQQGLAAKQTIGSQQAAVAAGGFGSSGSALSLLRASNQQAALGSATIGLQTAINVGGYQEQAASAMGQSSAALAQQAQAVEQAQAVGAQEAAASGAATAAGVAATSATQSANFNQAISTNEAANLATILGPIEMPNNSFGRIAEAQQNPTGYNGPDTSGNQLATAQAAFTAAGISAPASLGQAAAGMPQTAAVPGSVTLPGV